MAYYNYGLLENGNDVQDGDYLYSSIGLRITSPFTTIQRTVTWSYGGYGDSVTFDFDVARTTVQDVLNININKYIVVDNIRYEYVCWIDINPDGVLSYLSSTQITVRPIASGSYTYSLFMAVFARMTFTATFDANGGTGAPSSISYKSGRTITIPNNIPTYDGHIFGGWRYGNVTYQAGDTTEPLYENSIFSAIWNVAYTLTFDANGGTGAPGDIVFEDGDSVTIPDDIPVKPGFRFDGWSDDGGATVYYAGDTATFDGDTTLVAIWSSSPSPTPSDVSDTIARLRTSDYLAYRSDSNSLVYNT